jgi:hypothetical protein
MIGRQITTEPGAVAELVLELELFERVAFIKKQNILLKA